MLTKEQEFIENFGMFFEELGLTRMAGRVLALLLVADSPQQTLPDITEALQASKSSVSTATRFLMQAGFVDRLSLPGQRRDVYRISVDVWTRLFVGGQRKFTGFRQMAERGLLLLQDAPPERRKQLQEMYDFNAFLEAQYPAMVQCWQERRKHRRDA